MIVVDEQPQKAPKMRRRPHVTVGRMTVDQLLQAICPSCRVICKVGSTPESGASRVQYRYCPKCGQSVKVSIGQ